MDYEKLFLQTLGALIEQNGGSIEAAMDQACITDPKIRKQLRELYNWDNE